MIGTLGVPDMGLVLANLLVVGLGAGVTYLVHTSGQGAPSLALVLAVGLLAGLANCVLAWRRLASRKPRGENGWAVGDWATVLMTVPFTAGVILNVSQWLLAANTPSLTPSAALPFALAFNLLGVVLSAFGVSWVPRGWGPTDRA